MDKVAYIFDAPESYYSCALAEMQANKLVCRVGGRAESGIDCPLVTIPEREIEWFDDNRSDYERGYNACIDDLLDDEEGVNNG